MGQFLEIRDHTYHDPSLEFLRKLHVEVMSGPCCQEGYIFFYLYRKFDEPNLSALNSIFDFPPSLDLPYRYVTKEFNTTAFCHEISWDYRYDMSNSKGIIIRNPCIRVAQRLLACGLFARGGSMNVPRLFE